MKKAVKLFLMIYLSLGCLYAFTLGMFTMEVMFTDEDEHLFRIDHIKAAHYNNTTLILCAQARNADPDELDTPAMLGIVVPIQALWENADDLEDFYRPDWLAYSVYMPHRQLLTHCNLPDNSYREITIQRFPNAKPGKFIDGFSKYELEGAISELGVGIQLLEIPTSFTGKRFSKHKQIVFVHDSPDLQGYRFLEIRLKSIFTEPKNAWSDYAWAFVKDAVSFPVQIIMWGNYAGAH